MAMQFAALRKESGLSQKGIAILVETSEQQISHLESSSYQGYSLSMICRVAEVLETSLRTQIQRHKRSMKHNVTESEAKHKSQR